MELDPDLASLVAGAKVGSEVAWRRLVEARQGRLVRLAWALTGDRHLAADLAQEAFVEAFLRIRQLRDSNAFDAWLRTILVRTARRHRKRGTLVAEPEPENRRTPEDELIGRELRQAVDQAIASLKPIYREALALAMEGPLRSAEAAKLLGCSPEAYRVRLHEARRVLRERLADFLEE